MASKINPSNPLTISAPSFRTKPNKVIKLSSYSPKNQTSTVKTANVVYNVSFKTLGAGKLGISTYPDFEYNPQGGFGLGTGEIVKDDEALDSKDEIFVCFDVKNMYIPALTSDTTKFLGLPLPPFLRIDIEPEVFQGRIHTESGKVDLEFAARFCFSVGGGLYRAPPLMVKTVLTSEESRGERKRGRGERMDGGGSCRLVGVAGVEPVGDVFLDSFLGLPNECLANLNAVISISESGPGLSSSS